MWQFVQAVLDLEASSRDRSAKRIVKRTVKRIGYLISAIAYSELALMIVKLILETGGTDGEARYRQIIHP